MTTSSAWIKEIEASLRGLDYERWRFFIQWLEVHTKLANLAGKNRRQASLTAWFDGLPAEKAQEEHGLIMREIIWCRDTPLPEFKRIASSEARRS